MRSDAFNSHADPVRTEVTGTQQIPISHVCDSDESKSKGITVDENLLRVCSTDESKSEIVIVDENSTEESESESICKSIKKTRENMQVMKHRMRNLWLQIIQSSTSRAILTH